MGAEGEAMSFNDGTKLMQAENDGRWHRVPASTVAVYTVTVTSTSTSTGEKL